MPDKREDVPELRGHAAEVVVRDVAFSVHVKDTERRGEHCSLLGHRLGVGAHTTRKVGDVRIVVAVTADVSLVVVGIVHRGLQQDGKDASAEPTPSTLETLQVRGGLVQWLDANRRIVGREPRVSQGVVGRESLCRVHNQ